MNKLLRLGGTAMWLRQIVLALAVCLSAPPLVRAQGRNVDIRAADGVALKGSYFSPNAPGPAVLLLHQCNMDRHAWDDLAGTLARGGFHVLTFTLRGFTDGAKSVPDHPFPQWSADIESAFAYLAAQPGVDQNRVAVGGASCGVGQAVTLASQHPNIRALMLLSGGPDPKGMDYIAATPSLPIFGAASSGDTAAAGTRSAVTESKNPRSLLKMYEGTEHGVAMFGPHPELPNIIAIWLQAQMASPK